MRFASWLGGAGAVAGMLLIGAEGCGSSVPTCGSVCSLPGAPTGCVDSCDASETASTAVGGTADFQAYLTCLENAGSYAAESGACKSAADTVEADTRRALLAPTSDADGGGAGDSLGGSGSTGSAPGGGSCAAATCDSVCAMAGAPADCPGGCSTAQSECASAGEEFQTVLVCLCESGGWIEGTTTSTPCAAAILALDQDCAAFDGVH